MRTEADSASAVDTKINEQLGHSWEEATLTLGVCEELDLESLSKKNGCTVRFIKREGKTMEYEFKMVPTPTCPTGTQASIEISENVAEDDSIIKVVATDFISRHALIDFLHYVLNLHLAELNIVGIYYQGSMGDVLDPGDKGMFASLWS